jgi:hypothetical protein
LDYHHRLEYSDPWYGWSYGVSSANTVEVNTYNSQNTVIRSTQIRRTGQGQIHVSDDAVGSCDLVKDNLIGSKYYLNIPLTSMQVFAAIREHLAFQEYVLDQKMDGSLNEENKKELKSLFVKAYDAGTFIIDEKFVSLFSSMFRQIHEFPIPAEILFKPSSKLIPVIQKQFLCGNIEQSRDSLYMYFENFYINQLRDKKKESDFFEIFPIDLDRSSFGCNLSSKYLFSLGFIFKDADRLDLLAQVMNQHPESDAYFHKSIHRFFVEFLGKVWPGQKDLTQADQFFNFYGNEGHTSRDFMPWVSDVEQGDNIDRYFSTYPFRSQEPESAIDLKIHTNELLLNLGTAVTADTFCKILYAHPLQETLDIKYFDWIFEKTKTNLSKRCDASAKEDSLIYEVLTLSRHFDLNESWLHVIQKLKEAGVGTVTSDGQSLCDPNSPKWSYDVRSKIKSPGYQQVMCK